MAAFESYPTIFRPKHGVDHADDHTHNPPHPGPEPEPDSAYLPVIDFRQINPENVSKACREWGMFRLAHHGVPAELLRRLHEEANGLFGLGFETKQGLPTSPMLYFWGSPAITMSGNANQTGPCAENTNWLEGFNVPLNKISDFRYDEDSRIESFRSLLEEYGSHQTRLAKTIFSSMAEHLNFPPSKSASYLSPPTGILRVYRYLRCHVADQRWGIGAHTDSSLLSIIHQDQVGGLQVYKDNEWLDVKPMQDTLVVNLGDMMQAMSDDDFVSVTHRVKVKKETERLSIGYFVFPAENVVIESSKYRSFTYPDFQAQNELDLKTMGEKIGLPRFRKGQSF